MSFAALETVKGAVTKAAGRSSNRAAFMMSSKGITVMKTGPALAEMPELARVTGAPVSGIKIIGKPIRIRKETLGTRIKILFRGGAD